MIGAETGTFSQFVGTAPRLSFHLDLHFGLLEGEGEEGVLAVLLCYLLDLGHGNVVPVLLGVDFVGFLLRLHFHVHLFFLLLHFLLHLLRLFLGLGLADALHLLDKLLNVTCIFLGGVSSLEGVVHDGSFELAAFVLPGLALPPTALGAFSYLVERVHLQLLVSLQLPTNHRVYLSQSSAKDGIELILNIVFGSEWEWMVPSGEEARKFSPSVTKLFVVFSEGLLFLNGPLVVSDAVVEVVVVPFAALFAVPPFYVKLGLHYSRDLRPTLHVLVLVEVLEDTVLLHRQTCTT